VTLLFQDHRYHIDRLIHAALQAVDPIKAVKRNLHKDGESLIVGANTYSLTQGRIFIVGIGKAALKMGLAASDVLSDRISAGILITKGDLDQAVAEDPTIVKELPDDISVFEASHPISDQRGVQATARVIRMLEDVTADDLVLTLISGGASALFTQPRVPLSDWQNLNDALLASGCTINELNAVRKSLDQVKGGGLIKFAAPAKCVSLILSDVVGNPLDVIGSGPTVPNPDDPAMARSIIVRYDLDMKLPADTWQRIEDQLDVIESQGPGEFGSSDNQIICDVRKAAMASVTEAKSLGFNSHLLTAQLEGEAKEVGRVVAALAKDARPGTCLVLGGETTVTLRGRGIGGRNQELALAAAIALDGYRNAAIASFATDGDDGPTDAAGAISTGETANLARENKIDPIDHLDRNDSFRLFEGVDQLIVTGPTGTNVNDLVFILRY
jgi:hydroxypyruvate reductase